MDVPPAQLVLEIVPAPLGTAPVAEVSAAADCDVQLVAIVEFAIGRLGAERTRLHYHVGRRDAKVRHRVAATASRGRCRVFRVFEVGQAGRDV